jgi:hypothetical protein
MGRVRVVRLIREPRRQFVTVVNIQNDFCAFSVSCRRNLIAYTFCRGERGVAVVLRSKNPRWSLAGAPMRSACDLAHRKYAFRLCQRNVSSWPRARGEAVSCERGRIFCVC